MELIEKNNMSRRKFLELTATIFAASSVIGGGAAVLSKKSSMNVAWRLNPGFRIHNLTDDKLEIYTHLQNGEILKHTFSGLEANLLRSIKSNQNIKKVIPKLAKKYHLTFSACQNHVQHLLQEFDQAKIIYFGEIMKVKITEVNYGG